MFKKLLLTAVFCFFAVFSELRTLNPHLLAQEYSSRQELTGDTMGPVVEMGVSESAVVQQVSMPQIEVEGDWIYVDGEKFFVKGMGYSGWRPHQLPWQERPDPILMENDFRMISEAGFNTLRTWSALTADELALARKYGLMVMQGIFVDPTRDFASPVYQNYVVNTVKNQVRHYVEESNVLMFLVANEPPVERVRTSGVENTEKVLSLMVDAVKQIDVKRLVTFSNWIQLCFIDHSMLPVIAYNVYMYEPAIVSFALTYKGFVEYLKKRIAIDKPLVITELGLSVSPTGPGKFGRGGNTEEEQRDGTIMMYDDVINAGATGACIFEWNDEWWKNYDYSEDQHKHETLDPEEWFGVLEIKDDSSDVSGRPRAIYDALKEYNYALIVNPKNIEFLSGGIPIEIYTTESVKKLSYRVASAEILKTKKLSELSWIAMQKSSKHWWNADWDSKASADGKQILEIQALDENDKVLCVKTREFWVNNQPGFVPPILKIALSTDKEKYYCGEKMGKIILTVSVKDNDDRPVKNMPIDYAFYESRFWQSVHGTKNSDDNGEVQVEYYINESGFVNIGAGALLKYGDYTRKFGSVIAVEVEKCETQKVVAVENNEAVETKIAEVAGLEKGK